VTFLRYWLVISAILLGAMATWAFAPVLFFVFAVLAGLGAASATMIYLARRLRAWREGQ
jgi:hypothetical protein